MFQIVRVREGVAKPLGAKKDEKKKGYCNVFNMRKKEKKRERPKFSVKSSPLQASFFLGLLLWVTLAQTHECMYVFVCVCERCDHL